ncbi:uncharacterized protein LOC107263118 isoform X1 [Cephus cinctus]|uniref:Uncharacterized protein LOC107263118 isoform X1 n=1 Tax=Cephus cinctus TaxID=211228 RepID=A0AAJ7FCU4_CEPCN|nr:uncharacterized protein LOC107263118 isoform X1 [Cephus cinctus]
MANNFYKTKILRRIISKWKAYHIQLIEYSMKIKTICSAIEIRLKTKILYHWKSYVVHKKCNRRRMFVSCNHYRKTLMSKGLKKLKAYRKYKKIKKLQLSYMKNALEKIKMNFQKMYLVKWRNALFNVARERHKLLKAEEFQVKLLTRKYIHHWMIFFQEHRVKKLRKKKLFNRAQFVFLKRFISIWYAKYQRALNDHDKENWANVIYEIKLKKKFFNIWKKYVKVRIERKLEFQAAKEFHKKLVLQEGLRHIFRICLHKIDERYESREKEIVRNALQDFDILKKFFNKWLRIVSTLSRDKKSSTDNIVRKNISKEKRPRLIIPNFIKNSASFPNIMKTAEKFNYEDNYKSYMLDEEYESLRFDQTDRKNPNVCRNDINEKTLSSESFSAYSLESTLNSTQPNIDSSPFFQKSPIQFKKDICTLAKPKGISQTLLPPSAFYVTSSNCSKLY